MNSVATTVKYQGIMSFPLAKAAIGGWHLRVASVATHHRP